MKKQIPFDWELYKSGEWKPVFRNTNKGKIIHIYPRNHEDFPFLYVSEKDNDFNTEFFCLNGTQYADDEERDHDILLEKIVEEKTFYINLYNEKIKGGFIQVFSELQHALDCRIGGANNFGTLKVTYTDEDLIK